MKATFLNARSPLRLLEKGLHGGVGDGNLGVVLAGPGVGKTAFLVGVALDTLLRGGHVVHVSLDHTVSHVKAWYDTLFEDLASQAHLEDEAHLHGQIDQRRSIRAYPPTGFSTAKLRQAVKVESEAGARPDLLVVEGFDFAAGADEVADLRALARELGVECWLSATSDGEQVDGLPDGVAAAEASLSVIVALEPEGDHVRLRALKDHDNPDLSALHVALDPRTLLLVRS